MKKIYIVQPAVPEYRVGFFNLISKNYDLRLFASEVDFLNVKSVKSLKNLSFVGVFKTILDVFFWQKGLPIWNICREADAVVINGNPRILNYMLLFALLKLFRVPSVWWGHGWSAGSHGLFAKFRIQLSRCATARLFYTDFEKDKINLAKTYALNNGLDSDKIVKFREKDGRNYESETKELIFVGRLTNKSNLSYLIDAMRNVNTNVHLKIIGDGECSNELRIKVKELSLQHRIEFLGAIFDEKKLAQHMNIAHGFIYPGSVGLSLIHAFNYGLPAILHNNRESHMPEFAAFSNGVNGLSYDEECSKSLVDTINKFERLDGVELQRLSVNAEKSVELTFNTNDMFRRFDNMIKEIL
ncbi:glycosyltransferase family 4 protein [Vibrio mediterranei]|uniref:glycosyltransferase family 4 protein n=1 Tax=Vibrio mediterranei TaxID=689 RepID=UPI004067E11A